MTASTSTVTISGAANGGVRQMLRLEALSVLAAAASAYFILGGNPWLFAILFFAPDLSFTGYALNARVGAAFYNAAHSYILPSLLAIAGLVFAMPILWQLALILVAHIAFDRSLGYGLKYAAGFTHTHLGTVGKKAA